MIITESSYIVKSGYLLEEVRIGTEVVWQTESLSAQEIWYRTASGRPVRPKNLAVASNTLLASGIYSIRCLCPVVYLKDAKTYTGGCFSGSDLTQIWFPDGLRVLGARCFQDCKDLESFTIGPEVTGIEKFAFNGCSGLKELRVKAEKPPILGVGAFKGVDPEIPVYVPDPGRYRGWGEFKNIIKI